MRCPNLSIVLFYDDLSVTKNKIQYFIKIDLVFIRIYLIGSLLGSDLWNNVPTSRYIMEARLLVLYSINATILSQFQQFSKTKRTNVIHTYKCVPFTVSFYGNISPYYNRDPVFTTFYMRTCFNTYRHTTWKPIHLMYSHKQFSRTTQICRRWILFKEKFYI